MRLRIGLFSLIVVPFVSFLVSSFPVQAAVSPTATTEVGATLLSPGAFSIRIVPSEVDKVKPGEVVTYTVYYQNLGEEDTASVGLKLSWGFEQDVVADYVTSSAQEVYGGSLPTVDLLNRTITWSVPVFHRGQDVQTTSFQLQTHRTHLYPGTYRFYVDGNLTVAETVVAEADRVTNRVIYEEGLPPVSIISEALIIYDVKLLEITAHHALVFWKTSQKTVGFVRYGLSGAYGLTTPPEEVFGEEHTASFDDLDPATVYHFRIVARSEKTEAVSDDYLFKTASEGVKIPTVDIGSLLFRAYNLRLHPSSEGILRIFPKVNLDVEVPIYGEGLSASLDLEGHPIPLFLQENPWFSGSFISPSGLGEYLITVEVEDKANNYIKVDLAKLSVIPPPQVLDTHMKPISQADVELYRFNPFVKRFLLFESDQFGQENPLVTGKEGRFTWIVPYGRYELRVNAFGFQPFRSEEVVMLQNGVFTTRAVLTKMPLGFLGRLWYWLRTLVVSLKGYLADFWESLVVGRMVEQLAIPLLFLGALAVFLKLIRRLGLTLRTLFKLLLGFPLLKEEKAWGEIRDTASGQPMFLVYLELFDAEGKKVGWTFTNRKGEFGFKEVADTYFLKMGKGGFEVPEWEFYHDPDHPHPGKMIQINYVPEKTWVQLWMSRCLKVPGRPVLSQGVELIEGVLLNLASFVIILGLLAALVSVVNNRQPSSWIILVLYLFLVPIWTLTLWLR